MRFFFVVLLAAFAVSGCSGRNYHTELHPDPRILIREWTRQTHQDTLSGIKSYDFSNPVFFENTLIFGNRTTGVTSIYPSLNQVRWEFPVSGGVNGPITVDQGKVYFGGGDGFFYSLSAETGRMVWKYDVRNNTTSRATVSQGRVLFTTTDDNVYCLDAGTGKWLWHYRRRSSPSTSIHGAAAPLVDGSDVIAGMSDGFIITLNINDGQLKWEKRLHFGAKFTDIDATPVLADQTLYVPAYDGALYALKRANGEVIWKYEAGGSKPVTLEDDRMYLPSSDGVVVALQRTNAKELWKFELDRGVPTQLVVTDRYVIVGSSFQYLYVIDKVTGKGLYRLNIGYDAGFSGSPAYDSSNGRVYFLSTAGNLYAFQVRKPARKARPYGATDPYIFFEN